MVNMAVNKSRWVNMGQYGNKKYHYRVAATHFHNEAAAPLFLTSSRRPHTVAVASASRRAKDRL